MLSLGHSGLVIIRIRGCHFVYGGSLFPIGNVIKFSVRDREVAPTF